jgi:2-methylaconitate cis-trans-isomerase PrpF
MTGTGAIAIAVAAAIPGTIIECTLGKRSDEICFGHPSGSLSVGASAVLENGEWTIVKAVMSRSARRLMEGWVRVPVTLGDDAKARYS